VSLLLAGHCIDMPVIVIKCTFVCLKNEQRQNKFVKPPESEHKTTKMLLKLYFADLFWSVSANCLQETVVIKCLYLYRR
jgi:hypothetical protein